MSTNRPHAYCAVVVDAAAGRVRVTEFVADDADDFIGLSGDAIAIESAPAADDELETWVRWAAADWGPDLAGRADALVIEVVRGQDPG